MQMRAARFCGGRRISVEDVSVPEPAAGEVRLRVHGAGICGGDLKNLQKDLAERFGPKTWGHELAGQIDAVGDAVTDFKPGDRATVEPLITCGQCPECVRGDYNLCPQMNVIGRPNAGGGGFAQYMTAPQQNVHRLPEGVSYEAGALAEVYAVVVHALRCVPVAGDDRVAVIGCGPVGLAAAQMAVAAGAKSVTLVGKPAGPLQVAARLEGVVTIDADAGDPVQAVMDQTGGRGAAVVFEAVGGRAETLTQAVQMAAPHGRVCKLGGHIAPYTFDDACARDRELTISWSFCYSRCEGKFDFETALEMMAAGRLDAEAIVTHRFSLDDIAEAFAAAADREGCGSVKVLVLP